jgi:TonB family protein
MRLPIYTPLLLSLLLPTGAEAQEKALPPECTKVNRVHGSFPKGPFKTLPTESFKGSPTVKFLIREDGSVSDVSIARSSGVADIDKKVLESVSQWKYKARPSGCGVIENQMTVIIHWGEAH